MPEGNPLPSWGKKGLHHFTIDTTKGTTSPCEEEACVVLNLIYTSENPLASSRRKRVSDFSRLKRPSGRPRRVLFEIHGSTPCPSKAYCRMLPVRGGRHFFDARNVYVPTRNWGRPPSVEKKPPSDLSMSCRIAVPSSPTTGKLGLISR